MAENGGKMNPTETNWRGKTGCKSTNITATPKRGTIMAVTPNGKQKQKNKSKMFPRNRKRTYRKVSKCILVQAKGFPLHQRMGTQFQWWYREEKGEAIHQGETVATR